MTIHGFTLQYCKIVSGYMILSNTWIYMLYEEINITSLKKKWLWLNAMIYGLEMTGNPEYEVSFTSQKHSFDECHWQKFFILFDHAEAEKKIP